LIHWEVYQYNISLFKIANSIVKLLLASYIFVVAYEESRYSSMDQHKYQYNISLFKIADSIVKLLLVSYIFVVAYENVNTSIL